MIDPKKPKREFRYQRETQQYFGITPDVELEGTMSGLTQERDAMTSIVANWEDVRELMMPIIIPMTEKINFLESQVTGLTEELDALTKERPQRNIQQLKEQSKKTAIELRKMFNLQEIDSEDKETSLSDMNGLFKEYGNEKIDSVELLRSMRDEEN